MDYPTELPFNKKSPTVMHIDLNSCFATIEQQANPNLRGKPIAVAAFKTDGGFILAPSVEAKSLGVKMGMRVRDGKKVCPNLIILEPDPRKYRNVHKALKNLLLHYTESVFPKSIDEFVLDLQGFPALDRGMIDVAAEIKQRIKSDIGDWITVSIGIAPNRYLAKVASGLHKPDGLDIIDSTNYLKVFKSLELADLNGIKHGNIERLNKHSIFTVLDFYKANPMELQQAFHAVTGHYWYQRLRGFEVDTASTHRRSYSNSVALGGKMITAEQLAPVLTKLVEKMSSRMRAAGYFARGVHLSLIFHSEKKVGWGQSHWHKGVTVSRGLFSSQDIYQVAYSLFPKPSLGFPVHVIAVSCFNLFEEKHLQLNMLEEVSKKLALTKAQDLINQKWGAFVVASAKMLGAKRMVRDRIAFGGIKELEEITLL